MHLMTSSNSLSGLINRVLVPCPDLVREEGLNGNMQTEGKETQFWKLHRKKTLNVETPAQSKEPQANLAQKLWSHLPSRDCERLGRKTLVIIPWTEH